MEVFKKTKKIDLKIYVSSKITTPNKFNCETQINVKNLIKF